MTFDRNMMMQELQQRDCRVIFRKTNGEERDMVCTLRQDAIPQATKDDPLSQKKVRAVGSPGSSGEGRVEVVIPPENLRRPPENG